MNDIVSQTLRLLSFSDANVRYVFAGMILLGLASGVLGSFTLLRKRALIGDALAHAALPGIGIAYILTGTKSTGVLLIGAYIAGVLGVLSLLAIRRYSRIKEDSALAIVLTVFFGVGIVILTYIQKSGRASQTGLDKFLFGQSASLNYSEVITIGITGLILVVFSLLFYKELKLLCFDPDYTSAQGFPSLLLDIILLAMTVAAVVIGLQAVGVVLMAALLIIPPATARLWTKKLGRMMILSGILGAIAGALGSYLSFLAPRMPSGPLTVVAGAGMFSISILFAPERGVISRLFRQIALRKKTSRENLLRAIAELLEIKTAKLNSTISIHELAKMRNWSIRDLRRKIPGLIRAGILTKMSGDEYIVTVSGVQLANKCLHRHRLWELYLMHEASIASDHVDRDADESEHYLTPELEKRLLEFADRKESELRSPHPINIEESIHA